MTFRKTKFTIGIGIILIFLGILFYFGMSSSMIAYLNVKDIVEAPSKKISKLVKVTGIVKPGSVKSDINNHTIKFLLVDSKEPKYKMEVSYSGIVPDNFKPGNNVVVRGKLLKSNIFNANQLLAKCPSKYKVSVSEKETAK